MPAGLLEAIGGTRVLYALFAAEARVSLRPSSRFAVTGDARRAQHRDDPWAPGFSCTLPEARLAGVPLVKEGPRVSTKLYAGNLPLSATAETLAVKFGKFGTVMSVTLDHNAVTGLSRRGAFVEMRNAFEAARAIAGLNFASFDGRVMSVYAALAAM